MVILRILLFLLPVAVNRPLSIRCYLGWVFGVNFINDAEDNCSSSSTSSSRSGKKTNSLIRTALAALLTERSIKQSKARSGKQLPLLLAVEVEDKGGWNCNQDNCPHGD